MTQQIRQAASTSDSSMGNTADVPLSPQHGLTTAQDSEQQRVTSEVEEILRRAGWPNAESRRDTSLPSDHATANMSLRQGFEAAYHEAIREVDPRWVAGHAWPLMISPWPTHDAQQVLGNWNEQWDEWQRLLVMNPRVFSLGSEPKSMTLAPEIVYDVLKCLAWSPECQGAGHVNHRIAMKTLEIADRMHSVADPPFVSSTSEGIMLLEWKLADDSSVELYVETDAAFPGAAVVVRRDEVKEIPLVSESELAELLTTLSRYPQAL